MAIARDLALGAATVFTKLRATQFSLRGTDLVLNGKVTTDTDNILHTLADRFGADRNCFQVSEEEGGSVAHWIERAAELFIEALTYGPRGLRSPFPPGDGLRGRAVPSG